MDPVRLLPNFRASIYGDQQILSTRQERLATDFETPKSVGTRKRYFKPSSFAVLELSNPTRPIISQSQSHTTSSLDVSVHYKKATPVFRGSKIKKCSVGPGSSLVLLVYKTELR